MLYQNHGFVYLNKILPHLGQKSNICQQQLHFTDFPTFEYVYNMSFIHGCSFLQCSPDHWSAVHRQWLGQFADCIRHLQQFQKILKEKYYSSGLRTWKSLMICCICSRCPATSFVQKEMPCMLATVTEMIHYFFISDHINNARSVQLI